MSRPVTLAVVVPCYNEHEALPETIKRLSELLQEFVRRGKLTEQSKLYCVDDGSTDGSWKIVERACRSFCNVSGIKLTRNFGHQNALLAGLTAAEGDAVVTMDADLQDDPGVVGQMIEEFRNGRDIVYGVRSRRQNDSLFKRTTAQVFYSLMRWMGVDIVRDHADYRLLSRRAIGWLTQFGEVDLFLRGLVPKVSANASTVYYERGERLFGETKYPLAKMLAFAWRGITSMTAFPLRLVTLCGFVISIGSVAMAFKAVITKLFTSSAVPGWASTVVPIYLLGGLQILCLGIIGEYVAKLFLETKRRPRYLVETRIGQRGNGGCREPHAIESTATPTLD